MNTLDGLQANIKFSQDHVGLSLNPMGIDETSRAGPTTDDISYLESAPLHYDLYDCTIDGTKKRNCQVDWNRDGQINSSAVRSYVSPGPFAPYSGVAEGLHGNAKDMEQLPTTLLSHGGVGAAAHTVSGTEYLYAIAASTADPATLYYSRTSATAGGWSTPAQLSTQTFRKDTQPAAEVFTVSGQSRLYVFATDASTAPIKYAYIDSSGTLSSWTAIPGQSATSSVRDVSTAVHNGKLAVVMRDINDTVGLKAQVNLMTSSGSWAGWQAAKVGTSDLQTIVTPALATGPDGYLYMATSDPSAFDRADALTLYRMDAARTWTDANPGKNPGDLSLWIPRARPAMRFVPHLTAPGSPLANGRGYLALWWTAKQNGYKGVRERPYYSWTWGTFTDTTRSVELGRESRFEANCFLQMQWDATHGTASPALVLKGNRLAALLTEQGPCGSPPLVSKAVRHLPYADGISQVPASADNDDAATIDYGLCTSLRCSAQCANWSTSCSMPPPEVAGPCLEAP